MPISRTAMHSRFSHANSAPPPRAPHHKHRPPPSTNTSLQHHHTSAQLQQQKTEVPDHFCTPQAPEHQTITTPLCANAPLHSTRAPDRSKTTAPAEQPSNTPPAHQSATARQHHTTAKWPCTFLAQAQQTDTCTGTEKSDIFIFRPWTTGQGRNLKTHIL